MFKPGQASCGLHQHSTRSYGKGVSAAVEHVPDTHAVLVQAPVPKNKAKNNEDFKNSHRVPMIQEKWYIYMCVCVYKKT